MRFYELRENRAPGHTGDIRAASKWFLPGAKCPGCRATWANAAVAYPCVDLSRHPQQAAFVVPRAEPLHEFERLRELIRPWAPEGAPLPPGTRFGPLVGKAWGRFGSFFFQNPWTLLVRREAMEALQQAGLRGVAGRKPELSFRQKKELPDLLELQLMPCGLLHADCLRQRPAPRDGWNPLPRATAALSGETYEALCVQGDGATFHRQPGECKARVRAARCTALCRVSRGRWEHRASVSVRGLLAPRSTRCLPPHLPQANTPKSNVLLSNSAQSIRDVPCFGVRPPLTASLDAGLLQERQATGP
ncbi:SitI6 family double-CXXCG motif immunity protein [Hyalangium gracile]|uniref:SitI6 family double-CXXCG motif immunity protein n=1 Tax=Hyalangium gracile TaxID=394092 RepID=UPI001CCEF883